uniref:Uncharacterized protein n=1 Tax=viral metagenome TaxID=1070528 RepID=A0A6H2A0B9_9ZZZZ
MPYAIRKSGNNFKVINEDTGQVKGTHTTKEKAQRQANLLRGVEHGWTPTGKPARSKR